MVTHRSDPRFVGTWVAVDANTGKEIGSTITFGPFGIGETQQGGVEKLRFRWRVDGSRFVANQSGGLDALIEGVKSLFASLTGNGPAANPMAQIFGEDEVFDLI